MTQTQPSRTDRDTTERTRTYAWADPYEIASHIGGRSGIETLRAMRDGELPPPPIMATLDFDRIDVPGEGQVEVFLTPKEFHYNPLGSVHGGVISALVDTAAGCAVHSSLPANMGYTSLDLHTRFLRPVTVASGQLRCVGSVTSKGRQTALGESHLYDAAGRLVAHATSTCLLFPLPPAA
jgi:uncharacterized protein (TIGR00369 family)